MEAPEPHQSRLFPGFTLETTGIQHSDDWFDGAHGVRLYSQSWRPQRQPRAAVVVVHGLFEHSGRYVSLADYLVPLGIAVASFDHRGHGRSQGLRGYVNRFSDYLDDLGTFCRSVSEKYPEIPTFIFGHSVGGTIAASYFADHQHDFAGCILSAATTMPGESVTRSSIVLARALSAVLPRIGVSFIDPWAISRDQRVVDAYLEDPLVYRGKIRARLGAELINEIERSLPSKAEKIEAPILLLHGRLDRLSNVEGSSRFFELVNSKDKSLKYYDGLYHELLNEPERAQVLADIGLWIENHIARNGKECALKPVKDAYGH